MKLTRSDLKCVVEEVIKFLEKHKAISDLEKMLGRKFSVNRFPEHYIKIHIRPSNAGTVAYKISYYANPGGIPLELVMNPMLGYSQIIVKFQGKISGFDCFYFDRFGNKMQSKCLPKANLELCKKELQDLIAYLEKEEKTEIN